MNFKPIGKICPCESGLEYAHCCGAADRNGFKILGKILNNGLIEGDLPTGLSESISSIKVTPDLYPAELALLRNHVQLVKMSRCSYSESIFLDSGRIMGTCGVESSAQWLLESTKHIIPETSPLIFHTAFSGSTLLSKALDLIYSCLPIREPEALNDLVTYSHSNASDLEKDKWFHRILSLLGRRYLESQPAVIKTNDMNNVLLKTVLLNRPDIPVLFMYTSMADFFSSCVKADIRKTWIRAHYLAVVDHIPKVIPSFQRDKINENSAGQLSAVFWSYNISLYYDALNITSLKLRSLNFSDMLEAPLDSVVACAKWFDLEPKKNIDADAEIRCLLAVNSKQVTRSWSPKKRRDDIAGIWKTNANELIAAEALAKHLLGDKYPEKRLPNWL